VCACIFCEEAERIPMVPLLNFEYGLFRSRLCKVPISVVKGCLSTAGSIICAFKGRTSCLSFFATGMDFCNVCSVAVWYV
jgi:hypothetical protein